MRGPRQRRRVNVLAAAAVLAGLLMGCGGTRTLKAGQVLDVALTEYRLDPGAVALAAGAVSITVHNYGRLTHDLVVAQGTRWLASTHPLWPGQSATLTVILTPGRYTMFSALLSDQSLGQYGSLTALR